MTRGDFNYESELEKDGRLEVGMTVWDGCTPDQVIDYLSIEQVRELRDVLNKIAPVDNKPSKND